MNYRLLLVPIFSLIIAISCKEPNNKTAEPIAPADTRATMEYNENQFDTVAKQTKDEETFTFSGGGTDPFWNVDFIKGQIHFKAPSATLRSFVAPIPEPEVSGNSTKYIAKSHRVIMEVLITNEECVNASSNTKNSHKVKVSIKPIAEENYNVYEGCGS